MSAPPTERMMELADRLYGWRGREQLGASDVLVWFREPEAEYGGIGVAFYGDALRLQRYALSGPLNNHGYGLDLGLQRALGFAAKTKRYPTGTHPERQTMEAPDPYVVSVLSGVEELAGEFLGVDEQVAATLMPSEGAPWSPRNEPTPYYSAKRGKVLTSERPDWVVRVEADEAKGWGVDFCQLAPRVTHCQSEAVIGAFARAPGQEFLVTHCSPVFERGEDPKATVKLIRECGGLLFPSLAVGQVPATNFGELVLVADVSLILPTLRPYKKRGRWPIVVYETDVWTATTREVVGKASMHALEQLTDVADYMYSPHLWVLGPPLRDDQAVPISAIKKLRTTLAKRHKIYRRELDREQLQAVQAAHFEDAAKYAYVEAKVNGVTDMSCYPVAVCPKPEARRCRAFLKGIGFSGDLLSIERPPEVEGRDPLWDYAWKVRDTLLAYAGRDPGRLVAELQE